MAQIRNRQAHLASRMFVEDHLMPILERAGWPKTIETTDMDGTAGRYLLERKRHFMFFEYKTGSNVATPKQNNRGELRTDGQIWALGNLIHALQTRGVLFVCGHPPIENCDMITDVTCFRIVYKDTLALEGVDSAVIMSHRLHVRYDDAADLAWWVEQWAKKANGTLSNFTTAFRKLILERDRYSDAYVIDNGAAITFQDWHKEAARSWT